MKILSKIQDHKNLGITIGNFDGVHQGHQEFLKSIKKSCESKGLEFGVITFVPHPHQILAPQDNYLINTYMERRELLSLCGVDCLYEIEFTRDLSTLRPGDFLDQYIFNGKGPDCFFVGFDFAFGAQKSGNHNFLGEYCTQNGIELMLCDQIKFEDSGVSSSIIRKHIGAGDLSIAGEMLSRYFFMSGLVIRGEGRGKMIGIPTINIQYSKQVILPPAGVYVSILEHDGSFFSAVTNIGDNPTFGSGRKTTVETHVLEFDQTIYGDNVRVHFVDKIRGEKKFSSADALVTQIKMDIEQAKKNHEQKTETGPHR